MDQPKIIKNATPPAPIRVRHKWPFDEMEIGDAFDISYLERDRVYQAACQRKRRGFGSYTVRKTAEGCYRVWRTA